MIILFSYLEDLDAYHCEYFFMFLFNAHKLLLTAQILAFFLTKTYLMLP
jgi:hypothetical protein